jgi:hypothetical protein
MSAFCSPLTVTKLPSGRWMVARAFKYEFKGEIIEVPEGFETDFASVPRGLWNIIPPDGEYTQGAVLHDFLYNRQFFSRAKCDWIFLDAMKVLNVPGWKRWAMYLAVRSFGWVPWKGYCG